MIVLLTGIAERVQITPRESTEQYEIVASENVNGDRQDFTIVNIEVQVL